MVSPILPKNCKWRCTPHLRGASPEDTAVGLHARNVFCFAADGDHRSGTAGTNVSRNRGGIFATIRRLRTVAGGIFKGKTIDLYIGTSAAMKRMAGCWRPIWGAICRAILPSSRKHDRRRHAAGEFSLQCCAEGRSGVRDLQSWHRFKSSCGKSMQRLQPWSAGPHGSCNNVGRLRSCRAGCGHLGSATLPRPDRIHVHSRRID